MSTFPIASLLILTTMWLAAWRAEAESSNITGPPNCTGSHTCGDVSIPYPFGISKGCRKKGFAITCDTSYSPHRPFIGDTQVELIDVNLALGQARVYKHVDRLCYNQRGIVVDNSSVAMDLTSQHVYKLSTRNVFTTVGCSALAIAEDDSVDSMANYFSMCASLCFNLTSVINGTCFGAGCCQLPVPKGLKSFDTSFVYFNNSDAFQLGLGCNYAFVVDKDSYNFTSADLVGQNLKSRNERGVPVVLDWSIGNATCEEARRNLTSYACIAENSECWDSVNGPGYICNCTEGYEGNPYLHNGCSDVNECEHREEYPCFGDCVNRAGYYTCSCPEGTSGDPQKKNGCRDNEKAFPLSLKVLIGILSSLFFLTATSFWLYLGLEKRKLMRSKHKFFEQNGGMILKRQMTPTTKNDNYFKIFTQHELEKATNNFDKKLIIGRGGHGTVYEGILEDKRTVAIKKSRIMEVSQTKEFAREMLILSQINHRNVIKLLGCCLEVEVPMLVYEFVSNGNLFHYLHDRNPRFSIPLDTRLRIAEESAEALAYLHSYASPPIVHGDVKCSNILLDEQFTAKVSDFGASKLAPKDEVQFATVVQGTCGYLDPEYLVTCQLTEKSDVYSFGVIILELLTRRKPLEFDASGREKSLVTVFHSAMKLGNFAEILDREIASEENMGLIVEVAQVATRCLNFAGDKRPTMKEVADSLQKLRRSEHQQATGRFDQQGTVLANYNAWGLDQAMSESFDHASAAGINSDDTTEVKALLQVDLER